MLNQAVNNSTMTEGLKVITGAEEQGITRVAAYCRVSRDIKVQQTSLDTQMATYYELIRKNPKWQLVEIYADQGKTGTTTKNRTEFNRMIQDAKDGKIDMILVKSVSRFARNTVDTLETTRMLSDIGVGVYFEKEGINTKGLASELLLTVFAAFAQEESHDFSESMKRNMRARFKMGIPKLARTYGFKNVNRHDLEIREDEARVVRRIFKLYTYGMAQNEIADILNRDCIPTPTGKEGTVWASCTIGGILHNEKMMGDCLMQKTVTVSHLDHESVKNDGSIVEQYYKKNHHPAIVDRETFDIACQISYMRNSKHGASQYPYYGFLLCPDCGRPMVCTFFHRKDNRNMWICPGYGKSGPRTERHPCNDHMVYQIYIDRAVRKAFTELMPIGAFASMKADILDIQDRLKIKPTIEYIYLHKLVKWITFPDWDHIEITWKNDETTLLPLECDRGCEYPDPVMSMNPDGTCNFGSFVVSPCGVAA